MAKHDPQARRQAIVDAAADLIAEVGPGKITHRLVAARAQVPLGSTTAYFTSIDDLRQAALAKHVDEIDETLREMAEQIADDWEAAPGKLVDSLYDYLTDERAVASTAALNSTATFDPEVRALAQRWVDGMIAVLTDVLGPENAIAIALISDGACTHAGIRGGPIDKDALLHAFRPFLIRREAPETNVNSHD